MTVGELIVELDKFPRETKVLMEVNNEYVAAVEGVDWVVNGLGENVVLTDYRSQENVPA